MEAPVVGSMLLAAILLKLGGYGLIRILPLVVTTSSITLLIVITRIIGGSYVRVLCVQEKDIKVIIAYSSVRHMAIVIVCCLVKSELAAMAGLIIIISHGIASSGLFSLANIPYERSHSRSLVIQKGILSTAPLLSFFWFILTMANIGAPPTINLLREIIIIVSLVSFSKLCVGLIIIITFFAVSYSLILYSLPNQAQPKLLPSPMWPSQIRETAILLNHGNYVNILIILFVAASLYNNIKDISVSFFSYSLSRNRSVFTNFDKIF